MQGNQKKENQREENQPLLPAGARAARPVLDPQIESALRPLIEERLVDDPALDGGLEHLGACVDDYGAERVLHALTHVSGWARATARPLTRRALTPLLSAAIGKTTPKGPAR